MTSTLAAVYGPYPTHDPRRPYGVGCKTTGSRSFAWSFGHEDRAREVADGLRSGTLNPKEVL